MSSSPILAIHSISKSFGSTKALDSVSFSVEKGSIVGLAGENGAGKSTLIKILCGVHKPDSGTLELRGEAYRPKGPEEAEKRGISVFHQEIPVCPHLSVAANVFLGPAMPGKGLSPDWKRMNEECRRLYADLLGEDIDPTRLVRDCSTAETQLALLVRVLSRNASFIILDEPTTALTPPEVERLFTIIRRLRDRGVTFLFVSHMLEELVSLCDSIVVFRDGSFIGSLEKGEFDTRAISSMIAGRRLETVVRRTVKPRGETLLQVRNLGLGGEFDDVSFSVARGGILGIAGLAGSGRSAIARALFGSPPADSGTILIDGKECRISSPAEAIGHGIGMVPEDRKKLGLFHHLDVKLNLCMPGIDRFSGGAFVNEKKLRQATARASQDVHIKMSGPDAPVSSLSGGNQQKVLIARWLALRPRLIVMSEPTRGVDVGAKQEILALIQDLADQGYSFIIASSEHEELLRLSDDILVMSKGRMKILLPGDKATKDDLVLASST